MAKRLTEPQKQMYAEFSAMFIRCWACEADPLPREFQTGPYDKLENAHIVGGSGRVADRRAIVRLCNAHHLLQEGNTLRHNGDPLPKITLENMLWLKMVNDPDFYDIEFIRECRNRKNGIVFVPEPIALGG